jgi:glycosyltransferase involved in cell wall biosynthesis
LVLVGGAGNTLPEITALIEAKNLQQRVHILTGIGNHDLPAVYQAASLFVFPALYEGFGMPVAEALLSGVPVITTGGGAMQEAGGDAAMYTEPHSANELAGAMLQALSNDKLRTGMIERGLLHAQQFTAKAVAAKTIQVYAGL